MPAHTLAFWENRIREDRPELDRSMIKKVAKLTKRRFDNFTQEPTDQEMLEHYSTITYADPVPYQAIRNIESAVNAARRAAA